MRRDPSAHDPFVRNPKPDEPQKGVCRWCRGPVPAGRRRTWCSKECVDEYRLHSPGDQRRAVFMRDSGVCALCGRNCEALFNRVRLRIQRLDKGANNLRRLLMALRFPLASWYWPRSFWETDHIVPVSEGGGGLCGLSNLRTLCIPCHRRETAALAARRADRRRRAGR